MFNIQIKWIGHMPSTTTSTRGQRRTSADIRPIRSEADYDAALAEIERLWGAGRETRNADRLDVLATLVQAYEDATYPIGAPDPIVAITFRMEQANLTRRDLEPFIGRRARVSEVLSGKRPLTLAMIRRLHDGLGIPLESLISPNREVG